MCFAQTIVRLCLCCLHGLTCCYHILQYEVLEGSHRLANDSNAHRAYEKSQYSEDFGRIKVNLYLTRFSSHTLAFD